MSQAKKGKKAAGFFSQMWLNRETYLMLLPCLAWYFVFCYMPMGGLSLAFKSYNAKLGIWKSPWIGLQNYEFVFRDGAFYVALFNTLLISFLRLLIEFPVPIILALMLNIVISSKYRRFLQTVFTFPNFLSWVVVSGIMVTVFEPNGIVNAVLGVFGMDSVVFLGEPNIARVLLFVTNIWKTAGWSAIIYLAAIAGIDMEQYESAEIDGASRFQQTIYITLPSIKATISVLFVLAAGNMMNAGFDQIFNLANPAVLRTVDILDYYIYRMTFETAADFSFSTAISLMKSVVNLILLLFANQACKWIGEDGLIS